MYVEVRWRGKASAEAWAAQGAAGQKPAPVPARCRVRLLVSAPQGTTKLQRAPLLPFDHHA